MGDGTQGVEDTGWIKAGWMQTYTGGQFYPLAPHVQDINIVDIAHALSLQCRYNGHVRRFYSVAEHCIHLSRFVPPEYALWALLHDATEAYVGDMVRPLKISMPDFCAAEDRVMEAIAERYGLDTAVMPQVVKDADTRILVDEKRALMSTSPAAWTVDGMEGIGVKIEAWQPRVAEHWYLARFAELTVGA